MREYSYSELMQMQDKAIERVREMQERAKRTVIENPIEIPIHKDEEEKEEIKTETAFSPEPEKMPKNEPINNMKNPLMPSIKTDKDKATILPLLLLLMKEGADSLLILALIYIMA